MESTVSILNARCALHDSVSFPKIDIQCVHSLYIDQLNVRSLSTRDSTSCVSVLTICKRCGNELYMGCSPVIYLNWQLL